MTLKNPFITPSTRAFIEEARKVQGYSFFDFLHGYIYVQWPRLSCNNWVGEARWGVRLVTKHPFMGQKLTGSFSDPHSFNQSSLADGWPSEIVV